MRKGVFVWNVITLMDVLTPKIVIHQFFYAWFPPLVALNGTHDPNFDTNSMKWPPPLFLARAKIAELRWLRAAQACTTGNRAIQGELKPFVHGRFSRPIIHGGGGGVQRPSPPPINHIENCIKRFIYIHKAYTLIFFFFRKELQLPFLPYFDTQHSICEIFTCLLFCCRGVPGGPKI